MRGSELDAGLLGKSGEALKWMNTGVWSGDAKSFAGPMTGDIQTMLAHRAATPVAVHDLVAPVTGAGGTEESTTTSAQRVHPPMDHGGRPRQHAHRCPRGGQHDRPGRPHPAGHGRAAGETVHAFDWYAATHRDELLNVPGANNQSLGQLSPT